MIRRLIILCLSASLYAQTFYAQKLTNDERLREIVKEYGQAEVTVAITGYSLPEDLTRNVSIISVRDKEMEISLSTLTIEWFINQKFSYSINERSELKGIISAESVNKAFAWDTYPTYTQYDSIMQSFVLNYPSLCRLDTIGTSIKGKLVLALKISDNPAADETEPETFYSSTIHGDETGGYIMMLRLADFLLKSYDNNYRVKELIDNLEIWINPLANPDGTYNTGNEISSPIRFNADGVDLNRNFPDPTLNNIVLEKETSDMIKFMRRHRFVLSANFHSGSEVVNYPWDRWLSKFHADNDWFYDISRAYADTVHTYSIPDYMNDLDNGVTRGAVWYIIFGGRQDFMTQELHGREVTIELDNQYITPVSQLSALWEYNWRSLLGYLENALYGVHGVVIDSKSSAPVAAEIYIKGHDKDSSQVYTDTLTGSFVRLLAPGTWPLTFTADGYYDTTIIADIFEGQKTEINLQMVPVTTPPDTTLPAVPSLYPNPASTMIFAVLPDEIAGNINIRIIDYSGRVLIEYNKEATDGEPLQIDISRLSSGIYTSVFFNSKKNKSCRGRFIVIK